MNTKHLVAVYGSLRKGMINHSYLKDANAVHRGDFWTPPGYDMYDLYTFPAVVIPGNRSVFLEVYKVESLKELDVLEGSPEFYSRKLIDTPYGKAWLYYMTDEKLPDTAALIPEGDWVSFLKGLKDGREIVT